MLLVAAFIKRQDFLNPVHKRPYANILMFMFYNLCFMFYILCFMFYVLYFMFYNFL